MHPAGTDTLESLPSRWEVEWRVVEVACESLGFNRTDVSPDSRLFQDLHVDSLDLVEFILALEEVFNVSIPDADAEGFFVDQPATLRRVAELVLHRWGTGQPQRRHWWQRPRLPVPPVESAPFTQLGGCPSARDWLDGQLFEPLGVNREGYPQYRRRTDGMRCVLLPEAEAWIGSPDPDALADQRPVHPVPLNRFLIDAEPVSNLAFTRFLNAVGKVEPATLQEWCGVPPDDSRAAQFPLRQSWGGWQPVRGTERQPMMLVSWYGANAYALWANRRDWRGYRGDGKVPPQLDGCRVNAAPPPPNWLLSCLPSEAQWEYAARGREPRRFPWGDGPPTPGRARLAEHALGSSYTAENLPAAGVSDRLGMSPFGLHHMAGNVWQWGRDWYSPDFYRTPRASEPDAQNTQPSGIRCERGGSWVGPEVLARSSYRRGRPPGVRGRCLGFRCVGLPEDLP